MPHRDEHTLTITRTFKAAPDKVFRAWSEPDLLKVWMGGKGVESGYAEVDFRVGGGYRVRLQPPAGNPFYVEGIYQEIDPPKKIVYTWIFVGAEIETGETLVTVDFVPQANGTQVTLRHEKLPNAQIRDIHAEGWTGLLSNIDDLDLN